MRLFRPSSKTEQRNWKKGAILGFYTYMILLFINYTSYLFSGVELISVVVLFWAGLLVAFGYDFILSMQSMIGERKGN